ncbi:hypothetical protein CCP3SC1_40008 [Gammaproteobacteria bacterium]
MITVSINIKTVTETLWNDYQIIVATSGPGAIEVASSGKPNIILLDIVMPEMSGYTVCQWLKSNKDTKKIPIVFVTTNTNPEDIAREIEVRALCYLTKPVDTKFLRAIVKTALSSHIAPYTFEENTQCVKTRHLP